MSSHDVYAYGVVATSTLYRIGDAFPAAEGYAEITDVHEMTGGEATNSAIVLAKLGLRVKLDGNWLGADAAGRRTKALLTERGIDTGRLALRVGYEGVREVVVAAGDTRTIFGSYGALLAAEDWNTPVDEDIRQARVICLDPFFAEPATHAASVAHAAGVPVVTVDCRHDHPLVRHAAVIVIAESFLREHYADETPAVVLEQYLAATDGLVIFTFGAERGWYARPGQPTRFFEPFPIDAVDTTGGGDSFRAGIVYGVHQGWPDEKTVRFAAAVAALTCSTFPGVLNSPSLDAVLELVESTGSQEG